MFTHQTSLSMKVNEAPQSMCHLSSCADLSYAQSEMCRVEIRGDKFT